MAEQGLAGGQRARRGVRALSRGDDIPLETCLFRPVAPVSDAPEAFWHMLQARG